MAAATVSRPATASAVVDLGDVRLAVWDTRGGADAVVLLHAAVGHGDTWSAQHRSFRDAGYRVVSWSRRGHRGSTTGDAARPPSATHDLVRLLGRLGIERLHLVGTAYGAFHALDAALTLRDRLMSLTLSSSLCGITDESWTTTTARLLPPAWEMLPAEVRELSPAYRAAHPDGVRRWLAAVDGNERRVEQPTDHAATFALLGTIRTPTLVVGGDADAYLPPPRLREIVAAVPRAHGIVIREAGHNPAWEQPAAWDAAVLTHLAETSRRL
ncbi:MAG: alpha/beta fold hydrolase [Microbacterium sp.]|uniref:alpha/beta fold hydrolase n=1 Tax=Microbacterium sp. TaxID=51671 RepID=UPI0039E24172